MGSKGGGQTIGYWYDLDILMTLCHGQVDANSDFELRELRFGDRTGWSGTKNSSGTVSVYKSDLFGGESREGGVQGQVDVMMGQLTQPVNEYLGTSMRISGISGPVPAYRGELSLFFRGQTTPSSEFPTSGVFVKQASPPPLDPLNNIFGAAKPQPTSFRWSALNPYFKPVKALVARYWKGWYPARARIGDYANPAHIVYECLTNVEWGMGYPSADLDAARFQTAADTLYDEGFGLGIQWRQQTSIQDFLMLVLQHVNGVINQDRSTGKIFFRLVRNDYNIDTLLELTPANSVLENYSRPGFGETVNEITVRYTTDEGETDAVTVQDLANITSQGQVINQSIDMPGVHSATLAARIAQRELESRSKPLCKLTIVTNRIAFNLYEGEVFKFSWPDHGISQIICRVVSVDLGDLENNQITIEAVEDVFGLPSASYVSPQAGGWVDPSHPPVASPLRVITETPYYDIARLLPASDLQQLDPTDVYIDVFAESPSADAMDYYLWTTSGAATLEQRGYGSHAGVTTLTAALKQEVFSTLQVADSNALTNRLVSDNAYLIVGTEYMRIDSINPTTGAMTVARGVLDTVPVNHSIGETVILVNESAGRDGVQYVPGEEIKVRVQTRTSRGVLDVNSAPQDTYVTVGRQNKPYSPGRIRFNGIAYPEYVSGDVTIMWSSRNRLTQTAGIIDQNMTSIAPEAYTLTNVVVKDEVGLIVRSEVTHEPLITLYDYEELAAGHRDEADTRVLKAVGFGLISTPLSVALSGRNDRFTKVDGGWLGGTHFVSDSAVVTQRASSGDQTVGYPFEIKNGVYYSNQPFDYYVGWAVRVSPDSGTWDMPVSQLQAVDTRFTYDLRDRRPDTQFSIELTCRTASIVYFAQTQSDLRSIGHISVGARIHTKNNILVGPNSITRTPVHEYYTGVSDQFDSPVGWKLSSIGYPANGPLGAPSDPIRTSLLGSIFGSLLYVTYVGPNQSVNTAGKNIDVTNILESHIDVAYSLIETTRVFSVDLLGNLTLLSTRKAVVIADHLTSTLGIEAEGATLRTVDNATGAAVSTVATAPDVVVAICGDTVESTFYVLTKTNVLLKYSMTGVILASFTLPDSNKYQFNKFVETKIHVTLSKVYVIDKNRELHQLSKSFTNHVVIDISTSFNSEEAMNAGFMWSDVASSILYWAPTGQAGTGVQRSGLADETGSTSELPRVRTPRLSSSLTTEVSASRYDDGQEVKSYQKHVITTKRSGWGMWWGDKFGG